MAHVETARTRRRYVEEAGWRTTSGVSVLAGSLVAFGAVTFIAAGAGAAGSALGLDTEGISTNEWRQAGIAGAVVGALVLFGSFFFGGYTAGRMGRRAGARHGLLVFLLSLVLVGAVALITWAIGDADAVSDTLRDNGVPTTSDTWSDIGIGAAIAAGVAMLAGSILGGIRGDRWHGRLADAVFEHREAPREIESVTVLDDAPIDDTADRTETVDLTAVDHTDETMISDPSVEAEREATRSS